MKHLRSRPVELVALAFGLAAVAVVAIAAAYGWDAFADAWTGNHPGWLLLAIVATLFTVPAYAVGYRDVVKSCGGPRLGWALVLRLVAAGFGPFAPGGGFALDKRALQAFHEDEEAAVVRVLGLGALEWAILAPAAWLSAVVLLISGATRPMPSLLWPWAIAVPIGFIIAIPLATEKRSRRLRAGDRRWHSALAGAVDAILTLRVLGSDLLSCWKAWAGATTYWVLDIAAFYGAVRFVGLAPNLAETIVAYATGYALTRRSMPFGGAGITEVLMTFALHWVGWPVPSALAAVVTYRAFNFVVPTLPALLARPRVQPLLEAADEDRTPAAAELSEAGAPLFGQAGHAGVVSARVGSGS